MLNTLKISEDEVLSLFKRICEINQTRNVGLVYRDGKTVFLRDLYPVDEMGLTNWCLLKDLVRDLMEEKQCWKD